MMYTFKCITSLIVLTTVLGWGIGCQRPVTAPVPPIPGSTDTFDATAWQILTTAHGVAQSLSDDAKAGMFKPGPTEKILVNTFIVDLNQADTLYSAYHTGRATEAQMQSALTKVQSDQAALPSGVK